MGEERVRLGALLASLAVGLAAGCADRAELTDVDRTLLRDLFRFDAMHDADGGLIRELNSAYYSTFGLEPDDPVLPYYERSLELFEAHKELLEHADYRTTFEAAESELLDLLGERADEARGQEATFRALDREGLLARIVEQAGPSRAETVPPGIELDGWGSDTRPFTRGLPPAPPPSPAVAAFRYCTGAGELVVSGGDADPHVRAHRALYAEDAEYRQRFDAAIAPIVSQADATSPFDLQAGAELTTSLRRALASAGIADRLERWAEDD